MLYLISDHDFPSTNLLCYGAVLTKNGNFYNAIEYAKFIKKIVVLPTFLSLMSSIEFFIDFFKYIADLK